MGDEQQRALEGAEGLLERFPALEVEVVGRLVEDQDVGAGVHEHREREATAFSAGEAVDRLLGVIAAEEEPPEQRPGVVRGQLRRVLGRLEHRP